MRSASGRRDRQVGGPRHLDQFGLATDSDLLVKPEQVGLDRAARHAERHGGLGQVLSAGDPAEDAALRRG